MIQAVTRWLQHWNGKSLRSTQRRGQAGSIAHIFLQNHPMTQILDQVLQSGQSITLLYFDIVKMHDIEIKHGEEIVKRLIQALDDSIQFCVRDVFGQHESIVIENFWADDF